MIRAAALALALATGCGGGGGGGARGDTIASGLVAASGPALELSWPALDGGTIELARLRDQVVVIHAFAVWSIAAQLEVEHLNAADARDDVAVIGLALDPQGYPLVAPWRKGADARYLIALGDDAAREGTGPLGRIAQVPTTFVLDRRGRLHARFEYQLAAADLDAAIAAAARVP